MGRRNQCILNGRWRCIHYNAFLLNKFQNSYVLGFWRLVRAWDVKLFLKIVTQTIY